MLFFKNPSNGEVFAYESQKDRDDWGSPALVAMSESEVAAHLEKNSRPPLSAEDIRRAEARAYLADTDWYLVRRLETGAEVPEAVLAKRAEARALLN